MAANDASFLLAASVSRINMADALDPLFRDFLFGTNEMRSAANAQLLSLAGQPAYLPLFAQRLLNTQEQPGVRQLAGIVLEDAVKKSWLQVDPALKAQMRPAFIQGLLDPTSKLRTSVSKVIASIAQRDYPEQWPELPTQLTPLLYSMNAVAMSGSLRCLQYVGEHMTATEAPATLTTLSPILLRIFVEGTAPVRMRAHAADVFRIFVELLEHLNEAHPKECRRLLNEILPPWLDPLAQALVAPPAPGPDYCMQLSAMRLLHVLVDMFPRKTERHVQAMLPALWGSLTRGVGEYERDAVAGEGDNAQDSEGNVVGVEAAALQSLETLRLLSGGRFAPLLEPHLQNIAAIVIAHMQITSDQEDMWSSDPSQFVADDDDDALTFSVRTSGLSLLVELVESFGTPAILAIVNAAAQHVAAAAERRAQRNPNWWKLREAALLAVGTIADDVADHDAQAQFPADALLRDVLPQDLSPDSVEFLRGRALWTAAKLSSLSQPALWGPFANEAVIALTTRAPVPIRVCACRALTRFCPYMDQAVLAPVLPPVLQAVCALAADAGEDLLALVLETLARLVKLSADAAASVEASISSVALTAWSQYPEDAVISECAVDVVAALSSHESIRGVMQQRVVPVVVQFLNNVATTDPSVLDGAVALLTRVIQYAPTMSSQAVDSILPPLLNAMQAAVADGQMTSFMQLACDALRAIIKVAGTNMLAALNGQALPAVVNVCVSLLGDNVDDSGCLYVGPLVVTLLEKCGAAVMEAVPTLLVAALRRLGSSKMPSLKTSLMLVFAQVAQDNSRVLVDFLSQLTDQPPGALTGMLRVWCTVQELNVRPFEAALSLTALAKLLMLNDPRVLNASVIGYPVVNTQSGRSRRSAGPASQAVSYSNVPFVVRAIEFITNAASSLPDDDTDTESEFETESDDSESGPAQLSSAKSRRERKSPFAPQALYLDQILEAAQQGLDEDSDDEDEDLLMVSDHPVMQINLKEWLSQFLCQFAHMNAAAMQQIGSALPAHTQTRLLAILKPAGAAATS